MRPETSVLLHSTRVYSTSVDYVTYLAIPIEQKEKLPNVTSYLLIVH